jgi:hypothetical protein
VTDPRTLATEAIELAEKATPGPWVSKMKGHGVDIVADAGWIGRIEYDEDRGDDFLANANLVEHAGTHYATIARAYLEARAALRSCIGALQSAAAVSPDCSHEFHMLVPNEVAGHCRAMERRLKAPQFAHAWHRTADVRPPLEQRVLGYWAHVSWKPLMVVRLVLVDCARDGERRVWSKTGRRDWIEGVDEPSHWMPIALPEGEDGTPCAG